MARKSETPDNSTPTTDAPQDGQEAVVFKKPDLFDQIVARTDQKKRDVKPAVEAALAILAEALIRGEDLALPPLGKLRVVKSKALDEGVHVMTLKLRTMKDKTVAGKADLVENEDGG